MFWSNAAKKQVRRVHILRQIQLAHDQGVQPTPPSVGLKEKEFQEMADEDLFGWYRTEDNSEDLSTFVIGPLSEKAKGMLAEASLVQPASRAARICRALGIGLWDLAKIALGGLIGWYLKKHFP